MDIRFFNLEFSIIYNLLVNRVGIFGIKTLKPNTNIIEK